MFLFRSTIIISPLIYPLYSPISVNIISIKVISVPCDMFSSFVYGCHDDFINWKPFPRYWPLVLGEFPAQRPVRRSFDVFFDLRLNERLSKHSWGWWFETILRQLWRHCYGSMNDTYWKKLLLHINLMLYDIFRNARDVCEADLYTTKIAIVHWLYSIVDISSR